MTLYSDKSLSQRLERTEACSNADFVSTRSKMYPDSGAEWIDVNGSYAMFDGQESPLTQTFGLGLFTPLTLSDLETLEKFFKNRVSSVYHEISPMADPSHMQILFQRGYQPIEMTSVLYIDLDNRKPYYKTINPEMVTRRLRTGEEKIWAETSAEGWSTEMPGLSEFMYQFSHVAASSASAHPFFAELNDKSISTGMLYIYDDIALLAGASTIPQGRNKGAQNALLGARLRYAAEQGCTIAMMAASPGSQSQKNAEKNGFRIAYTRTKWKLAIL